MVRRLLIPWLIFTVAICLFACKQKSEYERLLEREWEKEVQNDSLFLGYHFGMTRMEFYDHSWALNKKGLVMQGDNNQTVEYETDELKHGATMNFYPDFHDDKIYRMPVLYAYKGWAPWNRELWADSLQQDIIDLYEKKYGDQFVRMNHPEQGIPSLIMIDGNRQIAVYKQRNDRTVVVVFTDLNVADQLESANEE